MELTLLFSADDKVGDEVAWRQTGEAGFKEQK